MIAISSTLRPKIEKTFKFKTLKEEEYIVVSLLIKNKSTRPIHNVEVTDLIPPIAKLVRDFEVLASRIKQVIEDYKLRIRLGYTGRQMVESQYTKERVTKDIIAIYNKYP